MAKQFGGKYSPDADSQPAQSTSREERPAYRGAKVAPAGARSNVLFIPGLLLAFFSINDGAIGMATGLAGAGA